MSMYNLKTSFKKSCKRRVSIGRQISCCVSLYLFQKFEPRKKRRQRSEAEKAANAHSNASRKGPPIHPSAWRGPLENQLSQVLGQRREKQSRARGELQMEVPWETEAAGDQERSSRRRRRRRQGKASASRSHSCDESKMQIGKGKRAEQVKNPSPPSPEKGEEEEEGQLLDDETAEDFMRSFRDGWESCFGGLYGYFEDNSKFLLPSELMIT